MTTKLNLNFIAETELARLYADAKHRQQWIPRSVCDETLKHPSREGKPPVHELKIADWWLEEHPFEDIVPSPRELL